MITWKTMDHDIEVAKEILFKHYDGEEEEIGIQEITFTQEGSIGIERADWVIELEETLENIYGIEQGTRVAKKVMSALIVDEDMVH